MIGGLRAGDFTHKGLIHRMDLCQGLCCNDSSCDIAIMMKGACFLVSCKNQSLCKPRHAELPNFSLKLSYKKRPGVKGKLRLRDYNIICLWFIILIIPVIFLLLAFLCHRLLATSYVAIQVTFLNIFQQGLAVSSCL